MPDVNVDPTEQLLARADNVVEHWQSWMGQEHAMVVNVIAPLAAALRAIRTKLAKEREHSEEAELGMRAEVRLREQHQRDLAATRTELETAREERDAAWRSGHRFATEVQTSAAEATLQQARQLARAAAKNGTFPSNDLNVWQLLELLKDEP